MWYLPVQLMAGALGKSGVWVLLIFFYHWLLQIKYFQLIFIKIFFIFFCDMQLYLISSNSWKYYQCFTVAFTEQPLSPLVSILVNLVFCQLAAFSEKKSVAVQELFMSRFELPATATLATSIMWATGIKCSSFSCLVRLNRIQIPKQFWFIALLWSIFNVPGFEVMCLPSSIYAQSVVLDFFFSLGIFLTSYYLISMCFCFNRWKEHCRNV